MISIPFKKRIVSLVMIFALVFTSVPIIASQNTQAAATSLNGGVTNSSVKLYKSSSTTSSVVATLSKSTYLNLLANSSKGFINVKTTNYTGYVSTRYVMGYTNTVAKFTATTTDKVNVRKTASSSATVLGTLNKGTVATVTSNSNTTWVKIKSGSLSGYIHKDNAVINIAIGKDTMTTTKALAIKSSKSTSSSTVYSLAKGKKVILLSSTSGRWSYVSYGSKKGYVPSQYLNKASGTYVSAYVKTTTSVNLRRGASTKNSVILTVPTGKTATFISNSYSGFVKVKYGSSTGYLSKSYVNYVFQKGISNVIPGASGTGISFSTYSATAYVGTTYHLKPTTSSTPTWQSNNTAVATVNSSGIVTVKAAGTAKITATISGGKATYTLTAKKPTTNVSISNTTYSGRKAKTLYLTASSGVTWSSSDTSVATVSGGLVYMKKNGSCVITASKSGGKATCLVTVGNYEAVRFAYASPNSASLNQTVKLVAITDKYRTAVKFVVNINGKKTTVNATSKTTSGDTYIWKASLKMTTAGDFATVAYSKVNGDWSSSGDSNFTTFVTSMENSTTTSCEERRASDDCISFISNYEGFISTAYYDPVTTGSFLTVGYGKVIWAGESFYNGMNKDEAYAYLVGTVNDNGYASAVNNFMLNNKIKFNQQQFDGLVSFVYNCGTGILNSDSDIKNMLLNTREVGTSTATKGIIKSSVPLRKSASGSSDKLTTLSAKQRVTFVSARIYRDTFYKVKDSMGNIGYVNYRYITGYDYTTTGTRDLNNTIKQNFVNNILCYHHAGGKCLIGLLRRRVDEFEIFYYGDYIRDGQNNKYDVSYNCTKDSSFVPG